MLSIDEKIKILKGNRLFKDLDIDDIKELANVAKEVSFNHGERFITEGDIGDSLYIIVEGQVKVYKSGIEFMLGVNEFVGEMAMIDDEPRSASVSSQGNTRLLKIDRDDFNCTICKNPNLIRIFLKMLSRKLRIGTIREDNTLIGVAKAGKIENGILPKADFQFQSIEISSAYYPHPSEKVMGDYYDYFPISDHQLGMAIGDVMGHGIHTGMIVAMAKGVIYTHSKFSTSISSTMETMNSMIYKFVNMSLSDLGELNPPYMTFCYIIIDTKKHTLSYSNSGHHAMPLLYRKSKGMFRSLKSHTFPLGIIDDIDHEVSRLSWAENDILVLYTDGIIDAENPHGKNYGKRRLRQAIAKNADLSSIEIKNAILNDIDNYCHGKYNDDRSLVVIKINDLC